MLGYSNSQTEFPIIMWKRLFISISLVASLAATVATAQKHDAHRHDRKEHAGKHGERNQPSPESANVNLTQGEVLRRGAALGDSPVVKLADVLSEPKKYAGKRVIVEGVVERVCQKQACWMEIAPEKGARGVRVQFGDHAFFVPFNSAGLRARAEGEVGIKHLTEAEATHLEREGAGNFTRDKDGEATEITFVAAGLELRK
jgi:Ni/Co efflux regulator RcnB